MKYFLTISIAIFILGCNLNHKDAKKNRLDELVHHAEYSDSVMQLDSSIKFYTQILEIDSKHVMALVNRGRARVWTGELVQGFADLDKAVMLYPTAIVYCKRGMMYVYIRNFEKALSDFKTAEALEPELGDVYYGMSYIKELEGDLNAALLFCNQAEEHNYPTEELVFRRAELYDAQKNYKAAIEEMTKLIKEAPQNPVYYNNRGFIRTHSQQYKEAIEDLDMAIKLDSSIAFAYNNKAYALLKLDRLNEALTEVNHSLALNSKNAFAFKNRGEVYIVLKQKEKACADLKNAELLSQDKALSEQIKALQLKACK